MPRPKEAPRVILTAHVLPETSEAIRAQVVKVKGGATTLGKVIDGKFNTEARSARSAE